MEWDWAVLTAGAVSGVLYLLLQLLQECEPCEGDGWEHVGGLGVGRMLGVLGLGLCLVSLFPLGWGGAGRGGAGQGVVIPPSSLRWRGDSWKER